MIWSPEIIVCRDGEPISVEIGFYEVSADHAGAIGGRYRLTVARIGTGNRPAVVFLSGGPGESGIDSLRHPPFRHAFLEIAGSHDVYLLDQRGIGRSEPTSRLAPLKWTSGALSSPDESLSMLRAQARDTVPVGFEPSTITPWQSAGDVVALADAIGQPKISLLAYSYGTHLAQSALKQDPGRFERVVLCGFEGPDQTYKLPERLQTQLEKLSALAPGDLLGDYAETQHRLHEAPLELALSTNQSVYFSDFGLDWMAASWIGLSNRFTKLPSLVRDLKTQLPAAVRGFAKMLDSRSPTFYLNDAASGATSLRQSRIDGGPGLLSGRAANFPFPDIREAWGQIDLGDSFRTPLRTDVPLLVFTGSLDGFTPTENFSESRDGLTSVRHYEIRNAAHNELLSHPDVAAAFLRGEALPTQELSVPAPTF